MFLFERVKGASELLLYKTRRALMSSSHRPAAIQNHESGGAIGRPRLLASFHSKFLLLALCLTPAFGQTALNLATQARNADFSTFSFTRTVTVGNSLPSTCGLGQLFFNSSSAPGSNLFGCTAANSWSVLGGNSYSFTPPLQLNGNTVSIPQATGSVDGFLSHTDWNTFSGKQPAGNYLTALTGDITAAGPGSAAATLATVNANTGTFGDSTHVPQITVNGKGLITSATSVGISVGGSGTVTHTVGALTSGQLVIGNGGADTRVSDLTGDVTTSGSTATTLATVNSSSGQCGDATHVCQITTDAKGRVTAQAPIGISGGGISNPMTAVGDMIVGGTSGAPARLAAGTNGYVLTIVSGTPAWAAPTGGSGNQCVQYASQLADFVPTFSSTSGGTLTVNAGASTTTPVIVRVGTSSFYRGTTAVSAYVTSGTNDTAYAYIDGNSSSGTYGQFVIGTSSAAIACTGCITASNITAFPASSHPLFTWTISSGAFVSNGYTDYRSFIQ